MHPLQGRSGAPREGVRLIERAAPRGGDAARAWTWGWRALRTLALTWCAAVAGGCVGPLALDGTSQSLGWHANGALRQPAVLPFKGDGYAVGAPWRARQSNHGTDELVELVVRASRSVARALPGAVVPVGDLSRPAGGGSAEHKSHQSGRDVDFFYFALRPDGSPVVPGDVMYHFDRTGRSASWSPPQGHRAPAERVPEVWFDARRNWRLVRALLTDPGVEVQWIFVQRDLAARLLQEARAAGEDPALVARAAAIVKQPVGSEPHDDHMHVRIFCDPDDRQEACADKGPARWWKKRWKYMTPPYGRGAGSDTASALLQLMRSREPLPVVGPNLTS
ncbi:MAG TPA: penicillin-insensitive murein endopeptidase [Polyangia bacterium]